MKKVNLLLAIVFLSSSYIFAQPGTGMQQAGAFGSMYSKLNVRQNPNRWERALGVYQATITPTSYLEVNTTVPYLPNALGTVNRGEVFKTSSPVDAHWRMFVGGATNQVSQIYTTLNGQNLNIETNFQINTGTVAVGGDIIFNTPGPGNPALGNITEKMRILGNVSLGPPFVPSPIGRQNRSGYIGINNPTPLFHMDMITPAWSAIVGGELFFRARPSDVPNSDVGFCNAAGGAGTFLPEFFGRVDASQAGRALQVLGNIDPAQDLTANNVNWGLTHFMSSIGWQFNNTAFPPLPVTQRHIFSWSNASLVKMLMDANGNLRIMNNMNTLTNIPGNRLEVTSGTGNPFFGSVNGSSGLRLTNMTSTNTPQANPGTGVLAVNAAGDVIYVNAPTGTSAGSGNVCGGTSNPLLNPWQIPLNGNRYNFTSPLSSALSQVNIGFNVCTTGPGRLNVQTDVHRFAGAFINNNGFVAGFNCVGVGGTATSSLTNAIGVRGQASGAPATFTASGVEGTSNVASAADANFGVSGNASNGTFQSAGGHFVADNSNSPANHGIMALANSNNAASQRDVGGLMAASIAPPNVPLRAIGAAGGINLSPLVNTAAGINLLPVGISIGVYGYNPNPNPAVIGPNWAGYFDGDVNINGNAYYTSSTFISSDKRYKKDVQPIGNVTEKIKKINSYTYFYKQDEFNEKNFDRDQQIGLIAQELKEVFPQLVKEDNKGFMAVNYQGMVPVLLEAIKEQQKQIDEKVAVNSDIQKQLEEQKKINDALQGRMDKLEQMISSCCSANQSGAKPNGLAVNLSDKNVIVLDQNVPNPFAESTVINFNIPTDFTKAQILFNAADGKVIKVVNVTEKGEGHLNVFANDLSNGMYSYSLIIDGKVVATKKMVKQN